MKYVLLPFIVVTSSTIAFCQTLDNYRQALSVLEKSKAAMGYTTDGFLISAKGTIHNLGHYEIPEKTKDLPLEETYGFFGNEKVTYLYSEMQNRGRTYQRTAVSKTDSLYSKGYYDRSFATAPPNHFAFEIAKTIPTELLRLTYENRKSLRYIGKQSPYTLISFSYAANENATLFIHDETGLLEKVETLGYHSLYGDVVFATVYKNFSDNHGMKIPAVRMEYELGILERELTYTSVSFGLKPDTTNLKTKGVPVPFVAKLAEAVPIGERFEFVSVSPTIDIIKITSQDNKALVAKFADHIALFEVPQGIVLNIQLMNELKKRYPDKPLRYLFVTHHHPDHAGGIRAYTNQPATLVTTAGNKTYFEKLLSTTHSVEVDRMAEETTTLKMDFVSLNGQKGFKDKANEVIAYEIGANTTHTAEHLVYYFPKSKILWTGDLLFFDEKGTVYPAGARGKSVFDLIEAKKLEVDKIYTSWPLHGQKEYGTTDFLKKLVTTN